MSKKSSFFLTLDSLFVLPSHEKEGGRVSNNFNEHFTTSYSFPVFTVSSN